jgi:hypothetical protein
MKLWIFKITVIVNEAKLAEPVHEQGQATLPVIRHRRVSEVVPGTRAMMIGPAV